MPLTGISIGTLVGLAIGAAFALLCRRNMARAVVVFTAIAWVTFIRVFDLAGSRVTQNLLLVEVLSTVMIAVWWLGRLHSTRPPVVPTSFNRPLVLMIPLSLISLLVSVTGRDTGIPADHVKLAVSLGQVLLLAWPVGLYFVAANSIRDTDTCRVLVRLIVVMAIPSLALMFVPPAWRVYVGWSIYFALVASPLCFSLSFDTRSLLKKIGLWVLAISPLLYGVAIGKAFLYITVATGLVVVAFLRARRLFLLAIPLCLGIYALTVAGSGSFVPTPIQALINVERQNQSWGGRAGRMALAADAIAIWARYPVFGVGPGNSWPYMHRYSVIDTPHNQYLNVLLELGFVGLVCFLWFIAGVLKAGVDLMRDTRVEFHRTLVIGWMGLFSGMVVSGLTGDFIFHSIRNGGLEMFSGYYLQWILLGMVVAVAEIERLDG
jgi:O-antigen ligase